jgi:hypothetical protein
MAEVNTGACSIYWDIQHTIFQSYYNSERANLSWYSTQTAMYGSIHDIYIHYSPLPSPPPPPKKDDITAE